MRSRNTKIILYSGLVFDGSVLEPHIFIGKRIPRYHNERGTVHFIPGIKGPSIRSTLAWLEHSIDYLRDEPLLVWDRLGGHRTDEVQGWLEHHNIENIFLPGRTCGILDPCDNSWHHQLREILRPLPHADTRQLLDSVIDAYWEPLDTEVQSYIKHCGYDSLEEPRNIVDRLFSSGYFPESAADPNADKMKRAYKAFMGALHQLRSNDDVLPKPFQLPDCDLDGVFWHQYQIK